MQSLYVPLQSVEQKLQDWLIMTGNTLINNRKLHRKNKRKQGSNAKGQLTHELYPQHATDKWKEKQGTDRHQKIFEEVRILESTNKMRGTSKRPY